MENSYKPRIKYLLFAACLSLTQGVFAQVNVIWDNSPNNTDEVTGTYNSLVVKAEATGAGFDINFRTGTNMSAPFGSTIFQTIGSLTSAPSRDLTFTFPEQVVVTRFEVRDINWSPTFGGGYDDSFSIDGADFDDATASASVTTSSVTAVGSPGTVLWECSRPLKEFKIEYTVTGGLTHAWLYYALRVIPVPEIGPFCLNSTPGALPATIGTNTGTWSPATIDTDVAGTTLYTFTPTAGQALECEVKLNITVLPDVITLFSPTNDLDNSMTNDLKHIGASDWIRATNKVNFGDNLPNNGVVYHAVNFIELNPGFESEFTSQFSAYIAPCASGYTYKDFDDGGVTAKDGAISGRDGTEKITIFPNPSSDKITVACAPGLKSIVITSIEGKKVLNRSLQSNIEEIDVSGFTAGIYLVTVESDEGKILQTKFVKN